jgi:hypothetical protein
MSSASSNPQHEPILGRSMLESRRRPDASRVMGGCRTWVFNGMSLNGSERPRHYEVAFACQRSRVRVSPGPLYNSPCTENRKYEEGSGSHREPGLSRSTPVRRRMRLQKATRPLVAKRRGTLPVRRGPRRSVWKGRPRASPARCLCRRGRSPGRGISGRAGLSGRGPPVRSPSPRPRRAPRRSGRGLARPGSST